MILIITNYTTTKPLEMWAACYVGGLNTGSKLISLTALFLVASVNNTLLLPLIALK